MIDSNVIQAEYHGDGPVLPGESVHQAMGMNTAYSLGGHLLRPGQSIEDEPVDGAERAAQHTAHNVSQGLQGGTPGPSYTAPTFTISDHAGQVRQALRPGS
jgi:hypothetical protein